MSDTQGGAVSGIKIAEKGELRWVSRCREAKQQVCFDVTCEYPGIEVWQVDDIEWRCQVRASEYEAMHIASSDSAKNAVRNALERLANRNLTPDTLLEFARSHMERVLGSST